MVISLAEKVFYTLVLTKNIGCDPCDGDHSKDGAEIKPLSALRMSHCSVKQVMSRERLNNAKTEQIQ